MNRFRAVAFAVFASFLLLVFVPCPASAQSNGVLREFYGNIPGNAVNDLINHPSFPSSPTRESIQPNFEAPVDEAEAFGQRMRALLTPTVSGNYTFWIASDDGGALFLSTTDSPAQKRQIATVNSWTSSREWNKEPNQKSLPIALVAGQRYYIEALAKEGGGGDNLAVTWQRPGDPTPANNAPPIPGSFLTPYGLGPPIITRQPTNTTVIEGNAATFSIALDHHLGAVFQWTRNDAPIPGATNNLLTLAALTLADTSSRFRCFVTNSYGGTNSIEAVLTVTPDTTRPTITTVGNLGEPTIVFIAYSEPVEADSATNAANYTIDNGVTVLRAGFGVDGRTILLTTTPIAPERIHTLTVSNVRDRATTPNPILPNTQRTFSVTTRPLDIGLLSLPREPLGPTTRRHGIVISEVMYHPTNRADGRDLEFVEIYNAQPWFEELGGWRISGAIDYTFPSNTVLASRSFLVVAANPADFRAVYSFTNVFGPFANSNRLQNSSGTLRVRNARDAVHFEMNYRGDPPWPAAADGAGHSLVLARPSYGERDPRAWAASTSVGGNPGASDAPSPDGFRTIVINEFLAHTDLPQVDFVELYNYGTTTVTLSGMILTDDPATNKFVVPTNTVIGPRAFVVFTQNELGFALSSGGETLFLKHPSGARVIDAVRFEAQENGVATGRFPDGAASFTRLAASTPGTNNAPFKPTDVVINEIMFDPVSSDADDEFVELHNRGTHPVDVGGWRLRDAVSFNIPRGTVIVPGGYLVIAKNAARLRANYPNLAPATLLGDYNGSLNNGGERLELNFPDEVVGTNALGQLSTNTIHITVDEVTYGAGGRWGRFATGGGSSLELRDARADRRLAPNWADSDESAKSPWVTVETTGVMDNGWADATQLHVTLMGAGEALIDNVEVIPAGRTNMIANGTFENGAGGWVFQGNHNQTSWEPSEGFNSARSLHLRAQGRGDSGANRVRTQLGQTLANGMTVTLRAKVRWLKGNPNLLLRLRGNWLEAPGVILAAKNLGTPGARNSRAQANAGPAITDVRHVPPLPAASQPVLVLARVNDPDGLAFLAVNYRVDPSTNFTTLAMTNNGAGVYSTVIPAQTNGATVSFFVQAADNFAPSASATFPVDAPLRECVVRWGDTTIPGTLPTYRFWVNATNVQRWSSEEKMSNTPKDITFLYGTNRVIYNAAGMFHGSPYHSPGYDSPVGGSCDYDLIFPDDDRLLGETDINLFRPGNGGGDGTAQAEIHGNWFGDQFGVPYLYHRPVVLFVNGQRRETIFHDAQQPNGDFVRQWFPDDNNGDLHKITLGFEFGDNATGANEQGYAVVGSQLARFTTTGGVKKQARYRATLPLRSASPSQQNDYTNLFALVDTVNTSAPLNTEAYTTTLASATDVEEWFKVHVTQHLYNNGDSFSYGGGQNGYIYKPERGPWNLLLFDIDFAFGGSPTDGNLLNIGGADHGPRNDHAPFRRIYWQALIEAANNLMSAARSNPILDARANGMAAGGTPVSSPQGIKDFIAARRTFILSQIAANQGTFNVTSQGGIDFSTDRNLIAITGTAPLEVRTILVNGAAYPITWTSTTAWSLRVPLVAGTNVLVLTGVDPKGRPVAGVSRTIRVNFTGAVESPRDRVVINEIMYHPLFANAGFVELLNTSRSNAFDLSGWRLNGADFTFPNGAVIEPNSYLVVAENRSVFAATYGGTIPVAAELRGQLDNGSETLTLIQPGATSADDVIIDQVTYDDDLPWSAFPDGGGASLQLIDPAQDNNRVANWAPLGMFAPTISTQWQQVVVSGTASSSTLYLYLQSVGDIYVDDFQLVAGSTPGAGANLLVNGDFESAFPGSAWTVSSNHAPSAISSVVRRTGNGSLHIVATSPGSGTSTAIAQNIAPPLVNGQTYTLSFWYLPSTNGGPLTARIVGSGLRADVNPPAPSGTNSARPTPGTNNIVRATLPAFPTLWLNEVLPNNFFLGTNGLTDRTGEHDPWVELYNGGTSTISLGGYYLANGYSNLTQWPFPAGTTIGPKGFLLVWLDGEPNESTANELHANFRAAPDAGSVVLTRGANFASIVDYLNYRVPVAGRSYGSLPDGAVSGRRLFALPTPGMTNSPAVLPVEVRINEWMADNVSALADPADGRFEDWFELFNAGSEAADLSGYFLSESISNATQWAIPAGTTIPAGGYLLVWADGSPNQNGSGRADLHAPFALAKTGEAIALFAPDGTVIDAVTFAAQTTDVSQGRVPDGDVTLAFMTNGTPRRANVISSANTAPSLAGIADKTVDEGTLLTFTAVATDPNAPPQRLTFALEPGAPSGAFINPSNGVFTWIPAEEHGPGSFAVSIRVTDDGSPGLSDVKSFTITVNEANNPPTLASLGSRTVDEETLLTVTNLATDSDAGPQTLTYSLAGTPPAGITIHPITGEIRWQPDEVFGPGNYVVTVRVTDNGTPPMSAEQPLSIFVNEVNRAPVIEPMRDRTVFPGALVEFDVVAHDTDLPLQVMSYTLSGDVPSGATIDSSSGRFSWATPTGGAGQTNLITVRVTDNGVPARFAETAFRLTLSTAPLIERIAREPAGIVLTWRAQPGRTYRVQFSDAVTGPVWTNLGAPITSNSPTASVTDSDAARGQRFYRIELVP